MPIEFNLLECLFNSQMTVKVSRKHCFSISLPVSYLMMNISTY